MTRDRNVTPLVACLLALPLGCTPASSSQSAATEASTAARPPPASSRSAPASSPVATQRAPAAAPPVDDAADALARALVSERTHVAYSPCANTVALLQCIQEEGAGEECRLVQLDVSIAEDARGEGLLLWQIGDSPEQKMPDALKNVAAELRAKRHAGLARVAWPEDAREVAVPGVGKLQIQKDAILSPRPNGLAPMSTPLERQTPPHRNRPVAVFAAPEHPVVVVEVSRDPGGKYGEGFNESNYFRVVHVGARMGEPPPKPLGKEVQHGGEYWAVYLDLAKPGSASLQASFRQAKAQTLSPTLGELACDHGAAAALGTNNELHAVRVYFATEESARRFAEQQSPRPRGIARVNAGCLD